MACSVHSLLRGLRVLAWGLLAMSSAMAQLDPRLQASTTDFLDLYQQSTSLKAKPEILSVFDFSRSMASLMFHPLFRNDDALNQDDDSRVLSIALSSSTPSSNGYYIQAHANNACNSITTQFGVVVDPSGNATPNYPSANPVQCVSTGLVYPFSVTAKTAPLTYAKAIFVPEAAFMATASHPYPNYFVSSALSSNTTTAPYQITHSDTLTAPLPTLDFSPSQPPGGYTAGTTVTVTTYLLHPPVEGDGADKKTLTWQRMTGLDPVTGANIPGFTSGTNLTGTMTTLDAIAGFYKSVTTFTVPYSTVTPNDPVQFGNLYVQKVNGASVSGPNYGSPWKSGDVLTFATYLITPGTANKIMWNSSWASGLSCGVPAITPLSSPSSVSDPNNPWTANWTIPSPCPVAAPVLLLSLDPRAGTSSVPGVTYLTEAWAGAPAILIKPNGAVVTATDADAAIGSSLENASAGRANVLNWIRAASHVRLSAVVDSKTRTIDVPIPWKLVDPASTSNPLASMTVLDQQIKAGLTYGSGLPIEVDQSYKHLTQAGGIFAGGAVVPATPASLNGVYLYGVTYRPAYLSWLFNAKYQGSDASKPNHTTESSLVGKFVVFDAVDKTLAGGQDNVSWGQGFGPAGSSWGNILVPQYAADGTYTGTIWDEASKYRIPALTRLQAVKQAAIQSWVAHQADAYWAFRFLDPTGEAGSGTATTLSNDSTTSSAGSSLALAATNAAKPGSILTGTYSGWSVLNNTAAQGPTATTGNSVNGMTLISHLFASGGTPTTYAMARALAQFTDPSSVFNAIEGTDVSQCGSSYLLLITDGADDNALGSLNAKTSSPYFTTGTDGSLTLDAGGGNRAIIANRTRSDRYNDYWNTFTLAGIGAHLADPSLGMVGTDYLAALDPGTTTRTGVPSTFLPMAIKKRNGITLNQDRRVLTMTLGLSLGGKYTDSNSPKRNLFLTAAAGDPGITAGPLSGFHPFDPTTDWLVDPRDPSGYPTVGKRKDGAVFFFDATNSDKLNTAMEYLFRVATGSLGNQATTSPSLPFVGASLGNQIYVGRFLPPASGGVLWSGDLLMFSTKEQNGSLSILDKSGGVASTLDYTTAQWSADVALRKGPVGTARRLFTRIPGGDALKPFTASAAELDFNHAVMGLKNFVATGIADLATKQLVIHHAAGGDITNLDSGTGLPKTNRSNIMGDIINSAPAAIEYKWSDVSAALSHYATLSAFDGTRFRLILVGTNQGWLHAFGEVTKTDATTGLVTGAVQELWSFLPTDFLANLNYLKDNSNAHRFMVDGTPVIYHLDLPPASGGRGNGVVDSNERAVAIFGLRKGGRSYYALDIHDPFNPALKWSLVPDEATSITADRIAAGGPTLSTAQTLLGKSGFSTSTPAIGRIQDSLGSLRDAVFLGGGASNTDVEAQFSGTKLGRFVMALDAYSGQILAAADLTEASAGGPLVGPVGTGLVPFEFILNSGMAQRAYFLDYRGCLWAWGSREVVATLPFTNFRRDHAKVANWSLRKVYQDSNVGYGARYTTLPAPFRVGSYPARSAAGTAVPAAVGIAMVSGDRNNPLDRYYAATNPAPTSHQLTVVFDRQDSRALGFDTEGGPDLGILTSQLKNFTANSVTETPPKACDDTLFKAITPGCDDYYLAPKSGNASYGYYVTFPAADPSTGFVPKGINPPLVVAGSLFYSFFTPVTANPCTGGTGTTDSWLIADVMNPIVKDTRLGLTITSGLKNTWAGVASDFLALGTRTVVQGGMREVTAADPLTGNPAIAALALKTTTTAGTERYPKARVWRSVR